VLRHMDLSRVILCGADLRFADFRSTSLSGAFLWEANLLGADFSAADLSYAHIGSAIYGSEDIPLYIQRSDVLYGVIPPSNVPIIKDIYQTVYDVIILKKVDKRLGSSFLDRLNCWYWLWLGAWSWAGVVVTLAGKEGRTLEKKYGTEMAATMIYIASDKNLTRTPKFNINNSEALEQIKSKGEIGKWMIN